MIRFSRSWGEMSYTGFPSPAEEHRRPALSLDTLLIRFPLNTFFVRYEGDALVGFGINHGDLLIVERSVQYQPGEIILVFVDGQRIVRQYQRFTDGPALCAANQRHRTIPLPEGAEIFGRVIHSITHHLRIKQSLPVVS